MRIETKALLLFLFVGYNLLLASVLASAFVVSGAPAKRTVSFGDSDFSPPAPQPNVPIRTSKPFLAFAGDTLSFDFYQYSVDNVTGFTIRSDECRDCNMVVVPLPLAPPPSVGSNGTIISGFDDYNVTKTTDYVLISDERNYMECYGHAECTVKLAGIVTETAPVPSSPYAGLPSQLEILGGAIIAATTLLWILRQFQLRRRPYGERLEERFR